MRGLIKAAVLSGVASVVLMANAEARITRIEIAKTEPAFGGQSFGTVGGYERLTGKAYGELDPTAPANGGIQDIALAPRNSRGLVEYVTGIDILRPADRSKGNGSCSSTSSTAATRAGFRCSMPTCRPLSMPSTT